jgi:hypothetical protein
MTNYPESGIKLVADTADYTQAMNDAIFLADYFDSLGSLEISVSANVDAASFEVELPTDGETIDITVDAEVDGIEDLPLDGETVDFTVEADVEGDLGDLPLNGETVHFTADGEVEGDAAKLPADGETIETTVDVAQTDQSKSVLDSVNMIKNLKVLETVWNIAGNALEVFGKFSSFAIDPMLALDDAVAKVRATTGDAIPNARELIKNIFYDDLGDSIDQVADLIVKAEQIKVPIDEAVRSALTFTHTFQDKNPQQVLDALDAMVKNKLAPDFKTAGDELVTAFQNGGNKGGDLLDTLKRNSTALHDMGLNGQEALGFIKTGLDNGFTSAQDVLNTLLKIKQNVSKAAGNDKSSVTETLNMLGIANPVETGQAWSADFFTSVIKSIQEAPVSDSEKQKMFANLVGGKIGAKEFSAFMKMSPEDAAAVFENVTGAAANAASQIDDSLHGAIDDFMLAAQKAAEDFLSSEQIDLPGKIAALKTGLQDGLDTLAKGGTLSDALTIALKPVGLDQTFLSLESAMGDFIIGILQVVSQLQSMSPANWEAKKGTDATIARMAEQQLTFKLKVDNPDDVAADIQTAVSRGVTPGNITKAVGQAVNELIATGSDEAIAKAQTLIDTLTKPIDQNKLPTLASGAPMNVEPVVTPEAVAALQQQINDALLKASPPQAVQKATDTVTDAFSSFQEQAGLTVTASDKATSSVDITTTSVTALGTATETTGTQATTATQPVTDVGNATQTYGQYADTAADDVQDLADATDDLGDSVSGAAAPVGDAANSMAVMTDSGFKLAGALDAANTKMGILIATSEKLAGANAAVAQKQSELDNQSTGDGGDTPTKKHALGTRDTTGTFMAGEAGREVITSNQHLAVLNNKTTEAIMAALQGYIPGGSFTRGGSTNIINNTNYIPNEAVADRLGFSQAATLRGQ